MIPRRFEAFVFGLIVSGVMSFVVSGVATLHAVGFVPDFLHAWISAWLFAWAVACPMILLVAPRARRLVQRLLVAEGP